MSVLGVIASLLLFVTLRSLETRLIQTRFKSSASVKTVLIQEEVTGVLDALGVVSALYDPIDEAGPESFEEYSWQILNRHSSIQALGWNPRVWQADRSTYEAACRAETSRDYVITERGPDGTMIPAAHRDEYVVVRYIEPFEGNESAFGYDVSSESRRREALQLARDTGELSITAPITLVQETQAQPGILAFVPKYRAGAPAGTVEQRRQNLTGFVVGVFRMADLVRRAIPDYNSAATEIHLLDASAADGEQVLFSNAATSGDVGLSDRFRGVGDIQPYQAEIHRGGRSWEIVFRPTEAFVAAQRTWAPWGALIAGLVIVGLLSSYLYVVRERAASVAQGEERLRLALDSVQDGVWDWDILTGRVFFSDTWLRSLGYRREEVQPTFDFLTSIVHPEDRPALEQSLKTHLEGASAVCQCEVRLRRQSGEYRWNLGRGQVVLRDDQGRPQRVIGTYSDVTERRLVEEERQRLEKQTQHSQKMESLGVLAGGVAHDFNNLLVGILTTADYLLSVTEESDPHRIELRQILRSGQQAAELTRQMLSFAGASSGKFESVNLSRIVTGSERLLRACLPGKVQLQLDLCPSDLVVHGNAIELQQVLLNLVGNSCDALAGEGGTVVVGTGCRRFRDAELEQMELGEELTEQEYLTLEVRDNGLGMDVATRARVFEPFFTTRFQGRGLGLAAVRGIVSRHQGAIDVQSEPGQGTSITVLLPESPGRVERRIDAVAGSGWRGQGTVLIIDDDPSVRRVSSRVIKTAGFEVLTAADGLQGVELLEQHSATVRAVLLDLTMPTLSGEETLRRIRELPSDVPVILYSGYDAEESLTGLKDVAFLQKPFGAAELIGALRAALTHENDAPANH